MTLSHTPPADEPATLDAVRARVLAVVRALARDVGGQRAERAVAPAASLERDVGLGSLERVELLVKLEQEFGHPVDDRFLAMDTTEEIAIALLDVGGGRWAVGDGQITAQMSSPSPAHRPAPTAHSAAPRAATIHEALFLHARAEPDRIHVWLRGDDGREEAITYGRLWEEASAVAVGLRERGVKPGDTVALMLPTGLDFLRAFQGILVAGAVPVPLYPPLRLDRLEEYTRRQSAILANADVRMMLTVPQAMPIARAIRAAVPSLTQVASVADVAQPGAQLRAVSGLPDDGALIQYTSGSTGTPKGVYLTHANLLANVRAIVAALDMSPARDVGASWLPLYHDMGLIGTWLNCLVHGIPLALMSPVAFLTRPERWLWAIHQHRVTLSPAPNFAYELCVRRVADSAIEGLDLSSWRCALNGAEPVSPDTLERFAKRYARHGFRPEAMLPVYGLAECTVGLAAPPIGRAPRVDAVAREPLAREGRAVPAASLAALGRGSNEPSPLRFVSVGSPLPGHEVRLVDDEGADVAERSVGHLLFRGPSMTSGYYRNPEATAAVLRPGGWMDSGDLAYRADGELFIAGREKDLVIKGGRNLVPQEIEEVAATVDGIRKGCVACFGVASETSGTESLVIVAETRATGAQEHERLAALVTAKVAEAVGVPPDRVVLVPPGAVPKTSSGKIRRGSARDLYLAGTLGGGDRTSLVRRAGLVAGAAWATAEPRLARGARALYAAWLAVPVALVGPLAWGLAAIAPTRGAVLRIGRAMSRLAMRFTGCRLTSEGAERLPRMGPLILACNHTSYVDIPALLALLPRDFVFVAKREVVGWPLIGTFVRRGGHPTVDRYSTQRAGEVDTIVEALRAGQVVLIFPEGTFTPAPGLRPFRLGGFKAAAEAGVPVVPLAITGARRVMRGDGPLPRPGPVHLWIGEPIAPTGRALADLLALRDRVSDAIAEHCGEPRIDIVSAAPPS